MSLEWLSASKFETFVLLHILHQVHYIPYFSVKLSRKNNFQVVFFSIYLPYPSLEKSLNNINSTKVITIRSLHQSINTFSPLKTTSCNFLSNDHNSPGRFNNILPKTGRIYVFRRNFMFH